MSRLETIQALAWSLPDVHPSLTRSESSGEVATRWVLCEGCDGAGVVVDRFGRGRACPDCDSAGRYKVDAVTEQRPGVEEPDTIERGRRVPCDRCAGSGMRPTRYLGGDGPERCASCAGTGRVLVLPRDETPPLLGTGLRSRGDWALVDAALGELRRRDRAAASAFLAALEAGPPPPRDEHDARDSCTPPASTPQSCPTCSEGIACPCRDASVRSQDGFCCVDSPSGCPDLVSGGLGLQNAVERANTFLLEVLPGNLRCPAGVLLAFRLRHDRARVFEGQRSKRVFRGGRRRLRAVELVRAGTPIPEVARELGISERTVRRAVAA